MRIRSARRRVRPTVRAVAERANVSPETVYRSFGGRPELVTALYDVTLAGDDEPDPALRVAGYARLARPISERVGVVTAALSAGGAEAAAIIEKTEAERLIGVTAFVRGIGLGAGIDPVAAAESCWVLTAPEVYRLCVAVRGWTGDAYETWLTRMLTATLLGP